MTDRRQFIRERLLLGHSPAAYLRSLLTPGLLASGALIAAGLATAAWRFAFGLGSVTHLTQTNPWGLWIAFDILAGVALAAGGYTVACGVYIFGLEQYRPIVRPAVLTGFLGYLFAVLGLLADLGQPWRLPYPLFRSFGTTSVMFEVGWCVFLYLTVLAFELTPPLFEWLGWERWRRRVGEVMLGAVVLGIVLSTLHQSSLGALFLLMPHRLHPLWYTPLLPLLFFVSSIVAGLAMVMVESGLSHRVFHHRLDPTAPVDLDALTLGLGKGTAMTLFTYFFLKLHALVAGGHWALLRTEWGLWYLVELLGFVALPCALLVHAVRRADAPLARSTAGLAVLGVVLNRLNVGLIAFGWNQAEIYVPSLGEVTVSASLVAMGVLAFRFVVDRMPVLAVPRQQVH